MLYHFVLYALRRAKIYFAGIADIDTPEIAAYLSVVADNRAVEHRLVNRCIVADDRIANNGIKNNRTFGNGRKRTDDRALYYCAGSDIHRRDDDSIAALTGMRFPL